MNEDLQSLVLKEYFPSDYTYHIEKMEIDPLDYRNFECTVRIKALLGAVDLCTRWLAQFSELTKTSWRDVREEITQTSRFQLSRNMVCNFGGCKIIDEGFSDRCVAHLKIRIKKHTYSVMYNDDLAARGFLSIINLSFIHNHLLLAFRSNFTHSYRPRHEITLMLLNYCRKGLSPNIAKKQHEKYIKKHTKEEGHSCFKDKALNPPLAMFCNSFKAWSDFEKAGFKLDLQFCRGIRRNFEELKKLGYIIQDHLAPNLTVVCTPIMQRYLKIIVKSVQSTKHVELTTQLQGTPSTKCILVVTAPSGVGPVPVCVAFYIREMSLYLRNKLHLSVRQVLNQFELKCDFDRSHDQFVLPESEEMLDGAPLKDLSLPASSVNKCVIPDPVLLILNNSKNASVPVCRDVHQFVLLSQEFEDVHEMVVDANQESEAVGVVNDPFEQVKTEPVETCNELLVNVDNSKVVKIEQVCIPQEDISKTRINLNYIADLVNVFQNDPQVISAVSVFNQNVDSIETPQQLAAFLTNFVSGLEKAN